MTVTALLRRRLISSSNLGANAQSVSLSPLLGRVGEGEGGGGRRSFKTLSLNRIQLVTFDVTGTLLSFAKPPAKFYQDVALIYGISVPDKHQFEQVFRQQFKQLSKEKPHFGMNWRAWWTEFVIRTFLQSSAKLTKRPTEPPPTQLLSGIANMLIERFGTAECWVVNGHVKLLLSHLKERGIIVGVISNFDPRLKQILFDAQLHPYFDFVLTSHECQLSKPDPAIFQLALRRFVDAGEGKLDPSGSALHIGDSYEVDYLGAKAAGWNGLLIGESIDFEVPPEVREFIVPDLRALFLEFKGSR